MSKVYLDGRFVDKLDAKVSVFDHGLLFGDGATVGLRIVAGKLPLLDASLDQLFATAARLGLRVSGDRAALAAAVLETVAVNARQVGYVRILLTRGAGMLAHDPRKCEPSVVIIADDVLPYPDDVTEHGLHVVTAKTVCRAGNVQDGGMTLSALTAVLAKQEALARGCLDAIITNAAGDVTGTIDAAVYLVTGGRVVTPDPASNPDAVYSRWLLDRCAEWGRAVDVTRVTPDDLRAADELFLAGTVTGVVPIVALDGAIVGDGTAGPVTRDIRRRAVQCHHE